MEVGIFSLEKHSIECNAERMSEQNQDILTFQELTGLGDYRVGILLAQNGMFVTRMKNGGRCFPETVLLIKANLAYEIVQRGLPRESFSSLSDADYAAALARQESAA